MKGFFQYFQHPLKKFGTLKKSMFFYQRMGLPMAAVFCNITQYFVILLFAL